MSEPYKLQISGAQRLPVEGTVFGEMMKSLRAGDGLTIEILPGANWEGSLKRLHYVAWELRNGASARKPTPG